MENVPVLDPVACYLFVCIVLAESLWTFQKTPKLTSAETNRSHCRSHTHSPACSSHIITNILFVTTGRYLSATCLLHSSACCDSPFSTDFIQSLQHCNLLTFLFYNALYIQYSFWHSTQNAFFVWLFWLCGKVKQTNYKLVVTNFFFRSFKLHSSGKHGHPIHCKDGIDVHCHSEEFIKSRSEIFITLVIRK